MKTFFVNPSTAIDETENAARIVIFSPANVDLLSNSMPNEIRIAEPDASAENWQEILSDEIKKAATALLAGGAKNLTVELSQAKNLFGALGLACKTLSEPDLPEGTAMILFPAVTTHLKQLKWTVDCEMQDTSFEDYKDAYARFEREIANADEPVFAELVNLHLQRKGMKAHELFDAIAMTKDYYYKCTTYGERRFRPSKARIAIIAIGLKLDLAETEELMHSIGYHLTTTETDDKILRFFLSKKIYELVEIYDAMVYFNCKEWIKMFSRDDDKNA